MQTTKQGERMWYSIETKVQRAEGLQWVKAEEWIWARKAWREGQPYDFPEYMGWEKEQWTEWIEEMVAE
jgi:hypothetical protein